MAGNIIPAIATTNAIIAGVIVMQALSILGGQMGKCKTVSGFLVIYTWITPLYSVIPYKLVLVSIQCI